MITSELKGGAVAEPVSDKGREAIRESLRDAFGFDGFRDGQEAVVTRLMDGKSRFIEEEDEGAESLDK